MTDYSKMSDFEINGAVLRSRLMSDFIKADVIIIDENPSATAKGINSRYGYINVFSCPPDPNEHRVFLGKDKAFIGIGLHEDFPDAEWSRGLYSDK